MERMDMEHRITWGWKGPLEIIWSNPTAKAGPPRAGCTGTCPGGFGLQMSPEKETPPPLWAACSSALPPSNPLLYPLQQFPVLLELGSPELDTVLQMGPHQGKYPSTLQPVKTPRRTKFILKDRSLWKDPQKQGRHMRRKEQQRRGVMD
ncbi:hypothetical protein llap_9380 [Limosa lapponica baueri]|uniref:Uncharacterized protein n=1 Tax=Limosa lapponica baueri TaxID=1758121 RepID=A0A2I0U2L4_LIMLA|nr:hypothetical protein llap_9380 [Limosa lapponica baueri]